MKWTVASLTVVGMLSGAATAFAKDAIQTGVSIPAGQPVPVMTEQGTGYTPGTYAVGDIQLDYTYVGMTFPEGLFATFNLNMSPAPRVQAAFCLMPA
jgi:hypothetical protein